MLGRPQKYLVSAVQTNAVHFWGSSAPPQGVSPEAVLQSNRLARSQRMRPSSGLGRPIVLLPNLNYPQGPGVMPTVGVIFNRPMRSRQQWVKSRLRPPVVVAPKVLDPQFHVEVTLAAVSTNRRSRDIRIGAVEVPGRNGRADSNGFGPFPPLVIGAKIAFGKNAYLLTRSRLLSNVQRLPKSRLSPPAVVTAAVVITYGGPRVKLVAPRSQNPILRSKLGAPAVVTAITFGGPRVKLAPPRETNPLVHSRLSLPVLGVASARPIFVKLTSRTTPVVHSRLPLVVVPQPSVVYPPIKVTLAPSTRLPRKPYSTWIAPTVLGEVEFGGTLIYLVQPPRQARVTHSRLSAAAVPPVVPVAETPFTISLAYSCRGRPLSKLNPPAVVAPRKVYPPIKVTLAASPRIDRTPHTRLRAPVVVLTAVELSGPEVTLAPSTRGRPMWALGPMGAPAVVYAPLSVTLAPSTRLGRRSHWKLRAPAVVFPPFMAAPIGTTLARIPAPRVHWRLFPPAVVTPKPHARPILTKLIRIRPPHTIHLRIGPPTILVPICFGCVAGYDYGPWAVGGDVADCVEGTDSGSTATGSDSAGTATGAAAPSGNVDGGDARREGC